MAGMNESQVRNEFANLKRSHDELERKVKKLQRKLDLLIRHLEVDLTDEQSIS